MNSDNLDLLANRPPPAVFCSPFGGGRDNCIWDRHTDRHTYGTDIQIDIYGESVHVLRFKIRPEMKARGQTEHRYCQPPL